MSDFDLFQFLQNPTGNTPEKKIEYSDCSHNDIRDENGVFLCVDCGQEIKRELNFDKEWRYYGTDDTRRNVDPNRCQIRKNEDRSIFKDVENMGFCEKIVHTANDIYTQITKGKIYRGNSRKSIVFACIFHAYKISSKPKSCDTLQHIFKLEKKIILKGLKFVSLNIPKDSNIGTKYITAVELIEEIMNKLVLSDEDKKEVIELYNTVKNKSSILNRSRPQSFAAGLIFYWITTRNKDVNLKYFIKKVNLSELTINKISKEISRILS
jgi:transcription initiation factor TFIIIB Brf1 subunit/transcription initiation factor TFIIB